MLCLSKQLCQDSCLSSFGPFHSTVSCGLCSSIGKSYGPKLLTYGAQWCFPKRMLIVSLWCSIALSPGTWGRTDCVCKWFPYVWFPYVFVLLCHRSICGSRKVLWTLAFPYFKFGMNHICFAFVRTFPTPTPTSICIISLAFEVSPWHLDFCSMFEILVGSL